MKRYMIRILLVTVFVSSLWFSYIQWRIHSIETPIFSKRYEVGIVLGAALWNNVPSPALKERLDQAYDLYREGWFPKVIVTGGVDHNGSTITEAQGMKAYLVKKGIHAEDIMLEEEARSTYENLLFSEKIMGNEGWEDALIITHEYHGARARDIAYFLKMKEPMVYPVTSQVLWMPWHKMRETLAFTKWIIERGQQAVGFASRT